MNFDPNKRVQVYKNLHKNLWSVRQAGKVLGHCETIILRNVRYLVGEAGRQRVIQTKRKNVHAVVSGYISNAKECNSQVDDSYCVVTYNPYRYSCFVRAKSKLPIFESDYADMDVKDKAGDCVLALFKK